MTDTEKLDITIKALKRYAEFSLIGKAAREALVKIELKEEKNLDQVDIFSKQPEYL